MKKILNDKKIIITMFSIILVLIVMSSTTYALFFKVHTMDNTESYTSGLLDIEVVEGNKLELINSLPITDEEGEVSSPYTLAITNKGTLTYIFDLKLLSTTVENQINPEYIKIKIDDKESVRLSELSEGIIGSNLMLGVGQTMTVTIRMWLSIDTPNTEIGKSFTGKVVTDGLGSQMNAIQLNYCSANNITNFKECLIRSDSYTDYDTALLNIDTKTSKLDLTNLDSIEPTNYYVTTKTDYNYDINSSSNMATTTGESFTYVEESNLIYEEGSSSPQNINFNIETGYYTYSNSKTGGIEDIITTEADIANGRYKYTCLNSTNNGNCQSLYVIYSYRKNNNIYEFKSGLKYSYKNIGSLTSNSGLFKTVDEYSKDTNTDGEIDSNFTYFYRGDVQNNWVEYAGSLWRIVRINGNGSIRMIYSGLAEKGASHTGQYASIKNSKNSYTSTYSSVSPNTNKVYYQGSTYSGYMYNPSLVLTTTPKYELSSTKNLNNFPLFTNINANSKYYFFNNFNLNSNCNPESEICTMTCTNYDSNTGVGDNCMSSTWSDLANNESNYNTSGIGSTTSNYTYTNNYKYTCWGYSTTTTNGNTLTVQCPIVSEVLGVVKNGDIMHKTQARVKYHGLFSESAESSSSNVADSNIKYEVDNWYEKNILNKYDSNGNLLSDYLSDEVFCNDRSIASGNGYNFDLGYVSTTYGAYYRNINKKSPSLICPNNNDKFTVSNEKGNGKLDYPIALLTIDEAALAGGKYSTMNYSYYLRTGQVYWTMSPSLFHVTNANAFVWYVSSTGYLSTSYPSSAYGVRPVVNLISDILYVSGSGTEDDPYKIMLN